MRRAWLSVLSQSTGRMANIRMQLTTETLRVPSAADASR